MKPPAVIFMSIERGEITPLELIDKNVVSV